MSAHAKLGASSAKRWLTCPGSVALSEGMPNPTSPAAYEGSAAHALAEHCLLTGDEVFEYLGESHPDPEYQDVPLNADMIDAVSIYVNHIRGYGKVNANQIEQQVSLAPLGDWAKEMFGTADFLRWDHKNRTIHIDDYKHGAGIVVEADSPQLKYYALGALLKGKVLNAAEKVVATIIQPRAFHPDGPIRSVTYTVDDLMAWVRDELEPGAKAAQAENAPLNPTPEACQFCLAKGKCPALQEAALADAMLEFSGDQATAVKKLNELTDAEIARILDNRKFVENWLKGVAEYAQRSLQDRKDVTGGRYKLVAGRSSRSWLNEEQAVTWLQEKAGLQREDLFTEKLVTPPQAEKAIGKDLREELKSLIAVTEGAPTMVPASDKRPALGSDATEDFGDVGEYDMDDLI